MEIVDGWSVESVKDEVTLTFTNRYGEGETYLFPKEDALYMALALLEHCKD